MKGSGITLHSVLSISLTSKEEMRAHFHLKAKTKRIAKLDFNPEKKEAAKAKRRKTSAAELVSTTRSGLEAAVEGSEVDSDAGTVDRHEAAEFRRGGRVIGHCCMR